MSRLFALMYDRFMAGTEDAGLRGMRAGLLAQAEGEVLEIGAGTGLNAAHYDRGRVTRLVLSEPDPHMAKRLRAKALDAEVVEAPGDRLPFADASFDTVACTLVLCTVRDQDAVLAEIARVLRPGGRLLFLEHVRHDDPKTARWQDRLERPWGWIGGGCHPNRDTVGRVRASPLELEDVQSTTLPKAPPLVRPAVAGSARRPQAPAPS